MKRKFPERLAALSLSLVMLLSCYAPYGFAAETDADSVKAEAETSETATVTEAQTVEATAEPNDAEAVTDAETVEAAPETDDAKAVTDVETVETAPETDDAKAVTDAKLPETATATDTETGNAQTATDAEVADAVEATPETNDAKTVTGAELPETATDAEMGAVKAVEDAFAVLYAESAGLTDFTSYNYPDKLEINETTGVVTLSLVQSDNHFVVYNGLEERINSFIWEADVDFPDGLALKCATLTFGIPSKSNPTADWYGAALDSNRHGDDAFRVFGPGIETNYDGSADGIDLTQTLHYRVDVHANGDFVYSFGNKGGTQKTISGNIPNWRGGYLGLLTWDSAATFSNIALERREEQVETPDFGTVATTDGFQYNNNIANANLSDLRTQGDGVWEAHSDGLYSNAVDKGDAFLYSQTTGSNFVYSSDVKFLQNQGAATLIFRNADANGHSECYAANIDANSKKCKLWRWQEGSDNQLFGEVQFDGDAADNAYTLTVVAIDTWLSFYVNGELIGSTGDYNKLDGADWGQDTFINSGTFGLLNWNGEMVFQNTLYTPIQGNFNPALSDINVTSNSGSVETKAQFVSTEPTIIQYVGNDASTVNIAATPVNSGALIRIYDADGTEYPNGNNIPVSVGANYIAVESSVTNADGVTATVTYRVNVHRRQADAVYYNEPYRGQYHYSVKDGWANDPNGLVYYNGTYHFFYQFYDDIYWGPMHWAHVTSKDLIHWEEQPVALYPDANGAMFSGCIVADENNTSGLFSGSNGGLVALITANGNGQRIKVAYSGDEGRTWTKVNQIAADWSHDPLYNRDFRDPKVFRWENKWFMVVAGGPLRIYSSDNLLEWQCEATYANLHTECPDLYPLRADDGVVKWVLSRGGRTYKVGDFKQVSGHWEFVPDADYANEPENGIMNFGKDSYAAMTYYVQDFGTAANPTLPEIVELNWMNTWEDYCNQVAEKTAQAFNGTFNLNLTLGLKNENGKYVLTQTPITVYETLRGAPVVTLTGAAVTENNSLLSDFSGDCYEIVSTFYPGTATKVGFDLRVGDGEKTVVRYDVAEQRLSIDRSQSGTIISNQFAQTDSQSVTPNADGSLDLRIYVDRSSVEAFAKGYTVAGANQIFPSVSSLGAAIVAEGGSATADVTIYPMNSVWEKVESNVPVEIISSGSGAVRANVGDELHFRATLVPISVAQNINWSLSDNTILSVTGSANGNDFRAVAAKAGDVTITATAAANSSLTKTFSVHVTENNFDTNIPAFTANGGEWTIDDRTLSVSNQSANQFYMSAEPISLSEFTLETNIRYTRGAINIFFAAEGLNPFWPQAYAVQFNDSSSFRLFRFGGDDIAPPTDMGKQANDGQFHNVKIRKTSDSVTVWVDNAESLNYTFEGVENFFNDGVYVGLGLWDGALDVQTFRVTENAVEKPVYTVAFDPNGGSGTKADERIREGEQLELPSNPFTPPANKKFKAWGIGDTQYDPGALYTVTGNTTVTALWTDNATSPGGNSSGSKGGCYVATAVYGSYDCPEVWTLRRFRDNVLAKTWYGRLFIKLYYAVSPVAVRLFGDADWFQTFWRERLDSMVSNLQADGFESTPYEDKAW